MSKALVTSAPEPAGAKVRRRSTAILCGVANAIDPVFAASFLGVAVCKVFNISATAHLNVWELAVIGLAAFGASEVLRRLAFCVADALDPDARDGDDALEAADILRLLREDVANGAEVDSVLDRLREANIGTGLGDLVADLANRYEDQGEHRFAVPLWAAAVKLRDADRAVAYGEV
ncbi:hypothetical protein ABZ686_02400 [Streptomyces sp. NPDC006992]|uniref:hypothetical protein n=1 Tax=Streptomyces sp. NPDC006992 TaxID=3155601 RepID=UPI0033ED69ED